MLKRLFCAVLLVSFLVGPVYSSSSKDYTAMSDQELLMSLNLQYQILTIQYNERMSLYLDLEEALKSMSESLEKEKLLSNQESLNYLSIKALYDNLLMEQVQSKVLLKILKGSLERLKIEIGSLERKIKTKNKIIGGLVVLTILEGIIIYFK